MYALDSNTTILLESFKEIKPNQNLNSIYAIFNILVVCTFECKLLSLPIQRFLNLLMNFI